MSTININISKVDLSLDQVDNTSDLNKPVSTATQTALDLKVDKVAGSRLITSAESTLLGNTSGTNTGDQNLSGLVPYTGATQSLVMPLSTNIVLMNALMTNAIAYVDNSNNLQTLSTVTYPNLTELSRVKGLTSAVQTQLNAMVSKTSVPWFQTIALSDLTTALTTGTTKAYFRTPYAVTLTGVSASVLTAPTGGTLLTIDINEGGVSILSTKLTFDASEKTTTTATTPAVISDTALALDSEITFDIDAVGSTIAGAGLLVTLTGTISI